MGMILSIALLGLASLIASGVLFRHQRVLTYLAAAGALFEGQWLLLTLLDRTVLLSVSSARVYVLGAFLLLVIWIFFRQGWSWPYFSGTGSGRRDVVAMVVLLVVLPGAWLVLSHNGWQGDQWITHGFYNGDTATFISLVQRSLTTDSLVDTNPFAGGGALEYPTLLHAGVAGLLGSLGLELNWLFFLPAMTLIQIFLTVPLFFLLWDVVFPEFNERWKLWFGVKSRLVVLAGQGLIVLFVLALSWDNYIYPQSHFFLTGLFLLQVALLARDRVMPASVVALLLMLSNAVTGTAAVAMVATYYLLKAADRTCAARRRAGYLIGTVWWVIAFFSFMPGEPTFGLIPHFSYTAASAMIRLGPVLVALLIATMLGLDKQKFLTTAISVLVMLAFATFFFSARNIVVENAERFIYHALLTGFPLLLGPVIRLWFWLKLELIDTAQPLAQRAAGWFAVAGLLLATALPAGASVASAHDNLMFKDERIVTLMQHDALAWIKDNLEPDAVILTSPEAPWMVPIFTGRTVVRVDSWLSPEDKTYEQIVAAFDGNREAQKQVVEEADYLLLKQNEQELWDHENYVQIFGNKNVDIYRLR
ncbi:MAG: hypothetical protein ABIH36_01330 [bacterium]